MLYEGEGSDEDRVAFATQRAKSLGYIEDGDLLVMTAGSQRLAGSTDLIRVLKVE